MFCIELCVTVYKTIHFLYLNIVQAAILCQVIYYEIHESEIFILSVNLILGEKTCTNYELYNLGQYTFKISYTHSFSFFFSQL